MSISRKNTALLGISLLAGLCVAVGCSREDEGDPASASSDIVQSQDLVIAQVYGGGGNGGATPAPYTHDFIELFNKSGADVSLDGKALQYGPSTGNFSATKNVVKLPNVVLKPHAYFVVQLAVGGSATVPAAGVALPKADYVTTTDVEMIAMSGSTGKVNLTTVANLLDACGKADAPCDQAKLDASIDFVGFGGANQFEGVATPALGNTIAAVRRAGGCADTGVNGSDFELLAPAPHLTDSPSCDSVDASVPPPPPPSDAGKEAGVKAEAGAKDAAAKPPKEAGAKPAKDAGAGKTKTNEGADDSSEDGDDDDDDTGATSSGSVTKPGTKTSTPEAPNPSAQQFGATQPDACSMSSGPTSNVAGFAGLFGLAFAAAAIRRRTKR